MPSHSHKPGSLKQTNKSHKTNNQSKRRGLGKTQATKPAQGGGGGGGKGPSSSVGSKESGRYSDSDSDRPMIVRPIINDKLF